MLNLFRTSPEKGGAYGEQQLLFDDTKQFALSQKIHNTPKYPIKRGTIVRIGSLPSNSTQYFDVLAEQNCLFDRLALHLIEMGIQPDMRVKIGDVVFSCYSQYLRVYSAVFTEIFANEKFVELPSKTVPAHIFKLIYRWICLKDIYVAESDFLDLYKAAQFLRMNVLLWNIELVDNSNIVLK